MKGRAEPDQPGSREREMCESTIVREKESAGQHIHVDKFNDNS